MVVKEDVGKIGEKSSIHIYARCMAVKRKELTRVMPLVYKVVASYGVGLNMV